MKILYTPLMIVPSLSAEQRAGILEAAGPGTVLVEAKEAARQRAEIVDTDILFGRVAPDIFVLNQRLRFYHSIGAGVDAVLSPELVQSDIPLASEKGGVGIHLAEPRSRSCSASRAACILLSAGLTEPGASDPRRVGAERNRRWHRA